MSAFKIFLLTILSVFLALSFSTTIILGSVNTNINSGNLDEISERAVYEIMERQNISLDMLRDYSDEIEEYCLNNENFYFADYDLTLPCDKLVDKYDEFEERDYGEVFVQKTKPIIKEKVSPYLEYSKKLFGVFLTISIVLSLGIIILSFSFHSSFLFLGFSAFFSAILLRGFNHFINGFDVYGLQVLNNVLLEIVKTIEISSNYLAAFSLLLISSGAVFYLVKRDSSKSLNR